MEKTEYEIELLGNGLLIRNGDERLCVEVDNGVVKASDPRLQQAVGKMILADVLSLMESWMTSKVKLKVRLVKL